MKKLLFVLLLGLAIYGFIEQNPGFIRSFTESRVTSGQSLAAAYERQQSGVQVGASGKVIRVLPDDNDGSRHQRFIIRLPSGQTVLIAHNIDLAPRIDTLSEGDEVDFFGEYEWNPKGGVVHWTHRDPAGRHEDGWLKHKGRTYQ